MNCDLIDFGTLLENTIKVSTLFLFSLSMLFFFEHTVYTTDYT
jgi:hypothetical protein